MKRDYAAALESLDRRVTFSAGARYPAVERTRKALAKLGLDTTPADRALVVAGTNGKGSTCAFLEALLLDAGVATGLFTSPHLISPCERIRVRGRDVSPELFAEAYFAIEPAARGLTHFEALTLMAAWIFAHEKVEFAIWEVGLGGTLDATNAIAHRHCAITRLGLDHGEHLGNTIAEIAKAKFGIVQGEQLVTHLPLPRETTRLAREVARRTGSHWREAPIFAHQTIQSGGRPRTWIATPWGRSELSLLGLRAAENSSLALALFERLGFDPSRHLGALARVRWPGRMERLAIANAPCPVYLSGDHNAQGIASLIEILPAFTRSHLHVIAAMGAARIPDEILGPLAALPQTSIYLTEIPFRGRPIDDYGEWRTRARGAWKDPHEALARVCRQARPGELIVATGSLYLAGALAAPSGASI